MKILFHMFRNENVGTEVVKFYLVTECAKYAVFNEWRGGHNVNEMIHENFFHLKALPGSLGSNFSKTTVNETIKMTDI
jgi:hypothetical protein